MRARPVSDPMHSLDIDVYALTDDALYTGIRSFDMVWQISRAYCKKKSKALLVGGIVTATLLK